MESFILMSEGTSTTEEGKIVPTVFIHLSSTLSENFQQKKKEILGVINKTWEHFPNIDKWRWQPRIDAFENRNVIKVTITDLEAGEYSSIVIIKFKNRGPKTRKNQIMVEKYETARQASQ